MDLLPCVSGMEKKGAFFLSYREEEKRMERPALLPAYQGRNLKEHGGQQFQGQEIRQILLEKWNKPLCVFSIWPQAVSGSQAGALATSVRLCPALVCVSKSPKSPYSGNQAMLVSEEAEQGAGDKSRNKEIDVLWELRGALLCSVLGPGCRNEVVLIMNFREKGSEFSTRLLNRRAENLQKSVLLFNQIKLCPKKMEV